MSKLEEILVEVRTFADDELVAESSFDPRRKFRLVRLLEFYGQLPVGPIVIPELGLDLSIDAVGRLPMYGFPVIAGPVPPGTYRSWVWGRLLRLPSSRLPVRKKIDALDWIRIKGFSTDGRTFGDAKCLPCRIGDVPCGIVVPGRTHYPEDIIEEIAPVALRRKLGVEDSDSVTVEVGQ